jgi:hypothetical protein
MGRKFIIALFKMHATARTAMTWIGEVRAASAVAFDQNASRNLVKVATGTSS